MIEEESSAKELIGFANTDNKLDAITIPQTFDSKGKRSSS